VLGQIPITTEPLSCWGRTEVIWVELHETPRLIHLILLEFPDPGFISYNRNNEALRALRLTATDCPISVMRKNSLFSQLPIGLQKRPGPPAGPGGETNSG